MSGFNSLAVLQALDTLAGAVSGVQAHYIGVPESFVARLIAYTTLAGQDMNDQTSGGALTRAARYRTTFAYALDTDEAGAETVLAAVVDDFVRAIYNARATWSTTPTLGNITSVNLALADDPRYVIEAGDEYREYPVEITVRQSWTVGT